MYLRFFLTIIGKLWHAVEQYLASLDGIGICSHCVDPVSGNGGDVDHNEEEDKKENDDAHCSS